MLVVNDVIVKLLWQLTNLVEYYCYFSLATVSETGSVFYGPVASPVYHRHAASCQHLSYRGVSPGTLTLPQKPPASLTSSSDLLSQGLGLARLSTPSWLGVNYLSNILRGCPLDTYQSWLGLPTLHHVCRQPLSPVLSFAINYSFAKTFQNRWSLVLKMFCFVGVRNEVCVRLCRCVRECVRAHLFVWVGC